MVSLSAWNLARAHLSIRIQVCQTIPAPSAPPPPTWPDCSAPGPAVLVDHVTACSSSSKVT